MVYIEEKQDGESIYYYHSHSFRLNGKVKKVSVYIGKDKTKALDYVVVLNSIKTISEKISDLLLGVYDAADLSFSESLVQNCLQKSFFVTNLRELDKNLDKKIDRLFMFNFIYNSNSIEGSKIPLDEVERIVANKNVKYENKNEILEVLNTIECSKYLEGEFKFNLKSVKKLHTLLTKDLRDDSGNFYTQGFRKVRIVVGFDGRETSDFRNISKNLQSLFEWYDLNKGKLLPLQLAFEFYFRYEQIHPFEDGNGRTGRLIMNKILSDRNCQPCIVFKENSQSHHRAFVRGEKGNMKYFYDFMFKQYKKTYDKIKLDLKKN